MKYRVENKYIVTDARIICLQEELKQFMAYDSHATENAYLIRSVYFDDLQNSCLHENEDGTDERGKFRIRTYNNKRDDIHLEQKSKTHGYTGKIAEPISLLDCMEYLNGNTVDIKKEDGFLKKKLYAGMLSKGLQPVCIVEYERTAFVEPLGNVRITFDQNIGGTDEVLTFWDDTLPCIPILPLGQHIMEVKYDEFLPDYIKAVINTGELQQTSYSKYYYTRVNENIV